MSLRIGSRYGAYEIIAKLGEGGMGEVYRAVDSRLERHVAIKVLPAALTEEESSLARFEREAKVLAQLHHPHIASIFGLEEADGVRALVLELVEGPTLAERLEQGRLPLEESLSIALQIAEALEEAHEKGIAHRDLKPQNVKAPLEGAVKVLDFGLAKAMDPATAASGAPSASRLAASPTLTLGATVQGVILGTPAYMAPEQAKGLAVDKRADIWAFGVVLWEMLTGRRLFDGDSVPEVLAAVLKGDIDLDELPPETPPAIRRLLRRCLERSPRDRLRDIGDARLVLEELRLGRGEPGDAMPGPRQRSPWPIAAAALALGVLATMAVSSVLGRGTEPPSAAPIRATITIPFPSTATDSIDRSIALSPDGDVLALALRPAVTARSQLYLRELDRLELRPLPGTEGATYPFWSPDGRSLGFFADGGLKRIDLENGIVRTLCEAPAGRGGTWGTRGTVVFAPGAGGALLQVSAEGGAPVPLTALETEGEGHRLPGFLPDGRTVLFHVQDRQPGEAAVYAWSPARGEARKILDSGTEARYVEPGFLAYVREENLMLQPFDAEELVLSGTARPIANAVHFDLNRNFLNLDLAAGGRLVYQEAVTLQGRRLVWTSPEGEETEALSEQLALDILNVRLSPDGRRAAVTATDSHKNLRLQVLDLERGTRSRIGNGVAGGAAWSPDGESLAVSVEIEGSKQLAWTPASGGDGPRPLTTDLGMDQRLGSVTPDGRTVLFGLMNMADYGSDLLLVDVDGGAPLRPYLVGPGFEGMPSLSPDGRWVVYLADASGRMEVWVADFPEARGRWQISTGFSPSAGLEALTVADIRFGGGIGYGWMSEDEIYWQDTEGRVSAVTIRARGGDLEISARALLAGRRLTPTERLLDYSFARERFLIARAEGPDPAPVFVVLSDWRAALRVGAQR